jgi:hypothetical protein
MSESTSTKVSKRLTGVGRWSFMSGLLVLAFACGDASVPAVRPFTGTGGSAGSSGTGGVFGTGGMSGTGGGAATGGSSGAGGSLGSCATSALCHTCPDQFLCDTDDDCAFSGYVCVASGCETHAGAPIKQCQPSRGRSCVSDSQCRNAIDYKCMTVGAGGKRCVRITAGCDPVTEVDDCVPGFSCEDGTCVDRRVPCVDYLDCPKSHVCSTTPTANFCVRVYRTCHADPFFPDPDCAGFGEFCADVDNDGTSECTGEFGSTGSACVNATCGSGSRPVCETGANGTDSACGDYGLCRTNADCDVTGGFECVGLWQDGRKECVRTGGTCDEVTDCDPQEVCAAPRTGGAPSCQVGTAVKEAT